MAKDSSKHISEIQRTEVELDKQYVQNFSTLSAVPNSNLNVNMT